MRETYIPWQCRIHEPIDFNPLSVMIGINSIIGHEFWPKNPERDPDGYYFFSTKFQIIAGFGQRWNLNIPDEKRCRWRSVSIYYDLCTNDKYVLSGITNKAIGFKDMMKLDIGIKFQML